MTIPRNLSFLAQGASSTGVLSVPYGGTGVTSFTTGYIPYGNGTGALNSSSLFQYNGNNLSVGVAPVTWLSGYLGVDLPSSSFIDVSSGPQIYSNLYRSASGSFIYRANGTANILATNGGELNFYTAPSGTAGNAATTTSVFNISNIGNMALGNSADPFSRGYSKMFGISNASAVAAFEINGASGSYSIIDMGAGGTRYGSISAQSTSVNLATFGSVPLYFYPGNSSPSVAMFSTGGVSIGNTTDPGATNLSVTGNATSASFIPSSSTIPTNGVFLPAANQVGFSTNTTETMRIDSTGNLLVGTTSAIGNGQFIVKPAGAKNGYTYYAGADNQNGATFFNASATQVGSIYCTNSLTAYITTSDYRLKENVEPMIGALNKVLQLKPVTYNWKLDGSSGQGFIAHELQAVVPDCVTGKKDAVNAEGKPVYQGIDTSFLVATLVSAIQQLNDKVTALETQLGK